MNKRIRQFGFSLLLLATLGLGSCSSKYSYETVPNDPLQARIYTLDNGLKVYMTVNKDEPRIQTYIAVRVGGKNDPAETTGLAHYFEHLMFKGTNHFGTQNYEVEKPLLDQIEQTFEVYRKTTDEAERKALYHVIDSLSFEASKYAIPNEYDKLMAAIGANGTNAYTSYDVTCYTEDIPSNQVENWAKIQADRFKNCVIRGFHTELETVYEEKNMSLTQDGRKVYEQTLAALFPHHPYGTQTVLGTQEDLKNPSITNIKNYFKTWYVPNNMAICLSGDFDPDQMITTIDKYFGDMQPNPNLPKLDLPKETPITAPVVREVFGPEAENVSLAWRFPGAASKDIETLQIVSQILYNGQAGLIDLDLAQQQKTLLAYCYPMTMSDYSAFLMAGRPKAGQTLDEVKDLLLGELKKLRDGDFDESLLEANINNFKLYQLKQQESNDARADWFVQSFINGSQWADEVTALDRMAKLTKQDIVDFANKYLKDDNYAIIYKRQGKDPNEKKIEKPQITPIVMNRDTVSAFLKEIQASTVQPIEPVFLDFSKDLTQLKAKDDIPVIYRHNSTNDLFELIYLFDMGNRNDKALGMAAQYLEYLGTSDMTPEQVKSEFYRMACTFYVSPGSVYCTLWPQRKHATGRDPVRETAGRRSSQPRSLQQPGGRPAEEPLRRQAEPVAELQPTDGLHRVGPHQLRHQPAERSRTEGHGSAATCRPHSPTEQLQAPHHLLRSQQDRRAAGRHQQGTPCARHPERRAAGHRVQATAYTGNQSLHRPLRSQEHLHGTDFEPRRKV